MSKPRGDPGHGMQARRSSGTGKRGETLGRSHVIVSSRRAALAVSVCSIAVAFGGLFSASLLLAACTTTIDIIYTSGDSEPADARAPSDGASGDTRSSDARS